MISIGGSGVAVGAGVSVNVGAGVSVMVGVVEGVGARSRPAPPPEMRVAANVPPAESRTNPARTPIARGSDSVTCWGARRRRGAAFGLPRSGPNSPPQTTQRVASVLIRDPHVGQMRRAGFGSGGAFATESV